jgi:hypothetical protein
MDNTLKPIEDFITSGLAERFFKVFGLPLLFYNGPDVKTICAKMLQSRGLPAYPFARAKTMSVAISENLYKPNTLLRRGLKSRASSDNLLTYELDLAPVSTTYEVTFYIQDFASVRKLVKDWIFAGIRNNLKFSVTYGVADIDMDIELDKQISIPTREGGVTEVKEYEIPLQMIVHGYLSENIRTVQAVTDLDVEIQVLEDMGAKGARVDIYHNDWPSCPTSIETGAGPGGTTITGDAYFEYPRTTPSTIWSVVHNLGKYPSVTVVDDQGQMVEASVYFPSLNVVIISFSVATTGTAFMN